MNYYENIDELPLYNWIKINDGKLNYCRLDLNQGTEKEDVKYFEILKDSNYKEFGISPEHLRLLDLQLQLSECNLDLIISSDNFIMNKIRRLESEMDELTNSDSKGITDIDETIISLSKWIGYRIDTKITTVKEFFKMISLLKKEVELNNKKDGKG